MSDALMKQSPIVELAVDQQLVDLAKLRITEVPFASYYIVRGLLNDAAFTGAVKMILNVELPGTANTMVENDDYSVFWMSPDQWMLMTNNADMVDKVSMLSGALEGVFGSVNDVSSGQTMLEISGEKAFEVMSKGTTFDVHPVQFTKGQCAQVVFTKSNALIYLLENDNEMIYRLIVRRSFADFIARWLINASFEYEE